MIHENGCLRAGEEWAERNLVPIAGATVALAVLQVLAPVATSVVEKEMLCCRLLPLEC